MTVRHYAIIFALWLNFQPTTDAAAQSLEVLDAAIPQVPVTLPETFFWRYVLSPQQPAQLNGQAIAMANDFSGQGRLVDSARALVLSARLETPAPADRLSRLERARRYAVSAGDLLMQAQVRLERAAALFRTGDTLAATANAIRAQSLFLAEGDMQELARTVSLIAILRTPMLRSAAIRSPGVRFGPPLEQFLGNDRIQPTLASESYAEIVASLGITDVPEGLNNWLRLIDAFQLYRSNRTRQAAEGWRIVAAADQVESGTRGMALLGLAQIELERLAGRAVPAEHIADIEGLRETLESARNAFESSQLSGGVAQSHIMLAIAEMLAGNHHDADSSIASAQSILNVLGDPRAFSDLGMLRISNAELADDTKRAHAGLEQALLGLSDHLPDANRTGQVWLQDIRRFVEEDPVLVGLADSRSLDARLAGAHAFHRWASNTGDPILIVISLNALATLLAEGGYREDAEYYRGLLEQAYQSYQARVPLAHRITRAAEIDFALYSLPQVAKNRSLATDLEKAFRFAAELYEASLEAEAKTIQEQYGGLGLSPDEIASLIEQQVNSRRRQLDAILRSYNAFTELLDAGDRRGAAKSYAEFLGRLQQTRRSENYDGAHAFSNNIRQSQKITENIDGELVDREIVMEISATYIVQRPDLNALELLRLTVHDSFERDIMIAALLERPSLVERAVDDFLSFYQLYRDHTQIPRGMDIPRTFRFGEYFDVDKQLNEPPEIEERSQALDAALDAHLSDYMASLEEEFVGELDDDPFRRDFPGEFSATESLDDPRDFLLRHYDVTNTQVEVLRHEVDKRPRGRGFEGSLSHEFRTFLLLADDSDFFIPPDADTSIDYLAEMQAIHSASWSNSPTGIPNFGDLLDRYVGRRMGEHWLGQVLSVDPSDFTQAVSPYQSFMSAGEMAIGANGADVLLLHDENVAFNAVAARLAESDTLRNLAVSIARLQLGLREMVASMGRSFELDGSQTSDSQALDEAVSQLSSLGTEFVELLTADSAESKDERDPYAFAQLFTQSIALWEATRYPELVFALVDDPQRMAEASRAVLSRALDAGPLSTDLSSDEIHDYFEIVIHYLLSNEWSRALSHLEILSQSVGHDDPVAGFQLQYLISLCHALLGDQAAAAESLRHAVDQVEMVRSGLRVRSLTMLLAPTRRLIYEQYASLLVESGQDDQLFELLARYKQPSQIPASILRKGVDRDLTAQANIAEVIFLYDILSRQDVWEPDSTSWAPLLDLLFGLIPNSGAGSTGDSRRGQTTATPTMLDALDAIGNSMVSELAVNSGDGTAALGQMAPAEGSLLVSYFVGRRGVYRVVRDSSGGIVADFKPIAAERILVLVRRFRQAIEDRSYDTEAASELHELLIADIRGLEPTERLVLWPDGPLSILPFQALRADTGRPYLVQSHVISYLGGKGDPDPQPAQPRSRPTYNGSDGIVIVANPDGTLEAAELEARQISQRAAFASTQILRGKDASLAALARTVEASDFLHFATHAQAQVAHPNFSYLQLAGVDRLYAIDLGGLSFRDKHLFLSACETRVGAHLPGEDVYGIADAFIAAGAASLVATLWRVESESTGLFADLYYGYLLVGNDGDAAIAAVARDFISRSEWLEANGSIQLLDNPYYWAAFNFLTAAGS